MLRLWSVGFFQSPRLHTADDPKRPTAWLEHLVDIIFAAAVLRLASWVPAPLTLHSAALFAGVFAAMWVSWTGITYYFNRFTIDDTPHRVGILLQVFALGSMAVTAPQVFGGAGVGFAAATGGTWLVTALLYARCAWHQQTGRHYSIYWGAVFAIGGSVWLVSILVPAPWSYAAWAVGFAGVIASPFSRRSRELAAAHPIDDLHLSERYGHLTLFLLGGALILAVQSLPQGQDGAGLLRALFATGTTVAFWWIYFDDIAGAKIRSQRIAPLIWLYSHLPLHLAIAALGVALPRVLAADLSQTADPALEVLFAGILGAILIGVAIIDSVTERRRKELSDALRVRVRVATGGLLVLLAAVHPPLDTGVLVALCSGVCVLQIVFDLVVAPYERNQLDDDAPAPTLAERLRADEPMPPPRPLEEAVRRGAPSELRRDLYFYFMEGSWTRVLVAFGALFFAINALFALLYSLEPGCIDGASPSSFGDAFFFSVQTISTIGYGGMTPATGYGNALVTVEAAVGIFLVALATGLMFAKASRARSSVLFSRPMVLTTLDGVRTLMFRVGNARGNDVIDASISVSVIVDHVSTEGHHLRRLHDLKLVRQRSPLFRLSWVVMHQIDNTSPCAEIDWDRPEERLISVIVTLTGHDGTFNETIYARHMYQPEDIRVKQRFIDVVSQLDDGRLVIDFTHFHDTVPDS